MAVHLYLKFNALKFNALPPGLFSLLPNAALSAASRCLIHRLHCSVSGNSGDTILIAAPHRRDARHGIIPLQAGGR